MTTQVRIGAAGLGEKELVVLRSALKLRAEAWLWVDAPQAADVWIADPVSCLGAEPARLILVAGDPEQVPGGAAAQVLTRPLKAVQLMRALDRMLAAGLPRVPPAAAIPSEPPAAQAAVPADPDWDVAGHPWRGRRLRLARPANLARYPVTAEMFGWVQRLSREAVSYDTLAAVLPLDGELLDTILNDAARDGQLVDEAGTRLPALTPDEAGLMDRLLGRTRRATG